MRLVSIAAVLIAGVLLTGCGSIKQTASDIKEQKPNLAVTHELKSETGTLR